MFAKNDSNFPEYNPIIYAQHLFLQKAVELKPKLVDDLCWPASVEYSTFSVSSKLNQMPFPMGLQMTPTMGLQQMTATMGFVQLSIATAPTWTKLKLASNLNVHAMNLRRSLLVWADRWNLNAEWCFDHALRFLHHISYFAISHRMFGEKDHSSYDRKQSNRKMFASGSIDNSLLIRFLETLLRRHGDLPPPPQGWPEWNPIREKRQAYIQGITQKTLNGIDTNPYLSSANKRSKRGLINSVVNVAEQYCKKIEDRKKQAKIQPKKLSRNIERNLLWSVKFQVVGMTYSAIADEYIITQNPMSRQTAKHRMSEGVDIATVKRSVEQTLKLLGLRKRPNSGPGRPFHAKDSHSAQIIRRLGVN